MRHTIAQADPVPLKDCGVRDSVERAIDLAKGLDLESWERRLREEPGRVPKWGSKESCEPPQQPHGPSSPTGRIAANSGIAAKIR